MAGLRGGGETSRHSWGFLLKGLKPSTRALGFAFIVTYKAGVGANTSSW